jgi:AmmeMemoRadiSam system protein B/AmmeMemoRadiSam system protein A
MFYPGTPEPLSDSIEKYLKGARTEHPAPKAMIAPHAGYVYSGPIAGTAYATLAEERDRIDRVVLIGPAHRVGFRGLALSSAEAFETPLGPVPVDRAAAASLLDDPAVRVIDQAHAPEHSLEVHLPFLQHVLGEFTCLPILVGDAPADVVDRVLAAVWGGPETLIVVSSDLSHYHDYETAQGLDKAASRAIELLQPEELRDEQACGNRAIRGLLRRAQTLDLRATALDLRNSGDTAGSRDSVVGYGTYVFEYGHEARLPERLRRQLMDAAAKTIRHGVEKGRPPEVGLGTFAPQLESTRASFVTLKLGGKLRGCIGSVAAHQPLVSDVVENAYKAAFNDPRFTRVAAAELDQLEVSVAILGALNPITFSDEADLATRLRPDVDGVVLQEGEQRGVFLPQVWEQVSDARGFLRHLKVKAGLDADYWSPGLQAWRFSVEKIGAD